MEYAEKQTTKKDREDVEAVTGDAALAGAEVHIDDADIDRILDEIDDVLEQNAEEYVSSFVQKGGQ